MKSRAFCISIVELPNYINLFEENCGSSVKERTTNKWIETAYTSLCIYLYSLGSIATRFYFLKFSHVLISNKVQTSSSWNWNRSWSCSSSWQAFRLLSRRCHLAKRKERKILHKERKLGWFVNIILQIHKIVLSDYIVQIRQIEEQNSFGKVPLWNFLNWGFVHRVS